MPFEGDGPELFEVPAMKPASCTPFHLRERDGIAVSRLDLRRIHHPAGDCNRNLTTPQELTGQALRNLTPLWFTPVVIFHSGCDLVTNETLTSKRPGVRSLKENTEPWES